MLKEAVKNKEKDEIDNIDISIVLNVKCFSLSVSMCRCDVMN